MLDTFDFDVADGEDVAGFLRLYRCGNSQQDDANGKPEQACQQVQLLGDGVHVDPGRVRHLEVTTDGDWLRALGKGLR